VRDRGVTIVLVTHFMEEAERLCDRVALIARERLRIIFGVGLPLLLVIIIGSIPFFNQPRAVYGGATFLDIYVPIMVAFSAALLSLTALPMRSWRWRRLGPPTGRRPPGCSSARPRSRPTC